jgi:hypothetical protein
VKQVNCVKKFFIGVIFLSFLLFFFLQTNNVAAQGSTTISVDPVASQTNTTCINTIQILATDVTDLYAFDLSVSFDPAILQVVDDNVATAGTQITQGSLLETGFTMVNTADNAAGNIRFATTQINPQSSKNGSGVLLVIRFRATSSGTSSISLTDAKLARPNGSIEPATLVNGTIQVSVLPANGHCPGFIDPTVTPSATSLKTVTPTRTPSKTPTRTSTPTYFKTVTRTATPTKTYDPSITATQALSPTYLIDSLSTPDLNASASASVTPIFGHTEENYLVLSKTPVQVVETTTSISQIPAWQDPEASLGEVFQDYEIRKFFLPVILFLLLVILIQLLFLQIRSDNR